MNYDVRRICMKIATYTHTQVVGFSTLIKNCFPVKMLLCWQTIENMVTCIITSTCSFFFVHSLDLVILIWGWHRNLSLFSSRNSWNDSNSTANIYNVINSMIKISAPNERPSECFVHSFRKMSSCFCVWVCVLMFAHYVYWSITVLIKSNYVHIHH